MLLAWGRSNPPAAPRTCGGAQIHFSQQLAQACDHRFVAGGRCARGVLLLRLLLLHSAAGGRGSGGGGGSLILHLDGCSRGSHRRSRLGYCRRRRWNDDGLR